MDQDEPRGDVVAAGATRETKGNAFSRFFGSIALFFRQVIAELRKVVTPTRKELFKFTAVVLVFVLIVMGIVYGLDTLFAWVTHIVFGVPDA
ncbi:preprotein translocase subunit SecE [Microbacterium sp. NPDC089695]|uniref:preprotein translocase subunit SecE n=1 Tax=Microbacterium sp. NPDC089695 TaxID=3364198 RepID=UPI0037FC3A5A